MKPLKLEEIVRAIDGRIVRQGKAEKIAGISTDTRTIKAGDLFIPLIGENFNGHKFIEDAVSKGAAAILTQELNIGLPVGTHIVYTNDTLNALQTLSSWYLKIFNPDIIAVTGSTGKTTCKDMIYQVLSQKFRALKTQGNFNNEIGLPLTLFNLDSSHEIAVLEMGMSDLGEISRLVELAPPKVGLITNIGLSHIERLGSRDNILKAKLELFENFDDSCTAVINNDDDLLRQAAKDFTFPHVSFGIKNQADYMAEDIELDGERGLSYNLKVKGQRQRIRLNAPGLHNVYNSLAAIAVARAFDLELDHIQRGLLDYKTDPMRMNIITIGDDIKIINDSYNASPDSVESALRVLASMKGQRRIAVLGDMLELGDFSQEAHRQVGASLAEKQIDILITRGEYGKWTIEGAINQGMSPTKLMQFNSNNDIIAWLKEILTEGDRILVKGSRGMQMEEIVMSLQDGRTDL